MELHADIDTHTHMFVSSKHLACNLKSVFGVLFPPLHNTGCKTVMLQNNILQIMSKLSLYTTRITFSSQVPWGRCVTFVGVRLCILLCPAQRALVVLGFFLQALGVHALIHHLAMVAEVETSSVRDADHRDVV